MRSRAILFWLACAASVGAAQLDVAYYPFEHKLRARATVSDISAAQPGGQARFVLTAADGTKELAAGSASVVTNLPRRRIGPNESNGRFVEAILNTPDLLTGNYTVTMTLGGISPLKQTFTRKTFEWEGNKNGVSRRVIPPFTPLKVEGRTVEAILRSHTMNGFGLWDQVRSEGEDILAAPIRFEADGVKLTPGKPRFIERSPVRVVVESAFRGGLLRAKAISEFDYDGMMKVTLDLDGDRDKKIDSLDLMIPLKDGVASLMHISGDSIRRNYAGKIPAGNGVIWQSKGANGKDLGYGGVWGTFMPYVWIGGTERGICWVADTDRDWSLDDDKSALDIVRDGDSVTLRVHLFNKPTVLDRSRHIVFGLQATPVKPMPESVNGQSWRSWFFHGRPQGSIKINILGQSLMWGAVEGDGEVYPRKRDFAIFDELARTRPTGNANLSWVEKSGWLDGYPDQSRRKEYFNNVISGLCSMDAERVILYTDPRGSEDSNCEECLSYNPRPLANNVWDEPSPSYQDFAMFYFRKMVEHGAIDGIYFDNMQARSNFDTISADAYVRPDGTLQPSLGIWNTRNLLKRAAVMFWEQGRKPFHVVHMTNCDIIPFLSFATIALDWEDKYGAMDFQDRWPNDFFLAESIGLQAGLVPLGLGGIVTKDPAEFRRLTRTQLGVALVHEIKLYNGQFDSDEMLRVYQKLYDHGYGLEDCKVWPYWQDQPIKIRDANVRSLVLMRGSTPLIVITNFGDAGEATIEVDVNKIGLHTGFTPKDIETGEKLPFTTGVFRLTLKKHDFRMIRLE